MLDDERDDRKWSDDPQPEHFEPPVDPEQVTTSFELLVSTSRKRRQNNKRLARLALSELTATRKKTMQFIQKQYPSRAKKYQKFVEKMVTEEPQSNENDKQTQGPPETDDSDKQESQEDANEEDREQEEEVPLIRKNRLNDLNRALQTSSPSSDPPLEPMHTPSPDQEVLSSNEEHHKNVQTVDEEQVQPTTPLFSQGATQTTHPRVEPKPSPPKTVAEWSAQARGLLGRRAAHQQKRKTVSKSGSGGPPVTQSTPRENTTIGRLHRAKKGIAATRFSPSSE